MDLLERSLQRFYTNEGNFDTLYEFACPEGKKRSSGVSLRVIEWLVTNYAKTHKVEYPMEGASIPFNLYMAYREQTDVYSKRMFDPFARRTKTKLVSARGDREIVTTPGQMNFFRWAINNGVVEYAKVHHEDIRADLPKCKDKVPRMHVRDGKVVKCRNRCKASDLAVILRPQVKRVVRRFIVRFD
eukprot:jgi/Mesvir1/10811/Mv21207-RA.1